MGHASDSKAQIGPFASLSDYAECRRLHRQFGTTYYFASRRFPGPIRRRVDALYGFVRVPDEWVDNPGVLDQTALEDKLRDYRTELLHGHEGICPTHPVLRAFCDTMRECHIPLEEPLLFLDAMAQDLTTTRYSTYGDLRDYMRGSAATVGLMMCCAIGAPSSDSVRRGAMALGEAMQLTNFLRDVGEDLDRGRIYLPMEDLATFGLDESDIASRRVTPRFVDLMRFEIARARALYAEADPSIRLLPSHARPAVRLARVLYSRILDRIEARQYDVFSGRARTTRLEKGLAALGVLLRG
ncbi:MAG: phytoene/squalene synthase family protein [Fimbriimonadaceae bacterium]|nr:phytoene/squalene synthase family protein [Fimbriimonadaceae bacterium]